jgi:undecaprenyl diphosphate synthase
VEACLELGIEYLTLYTFSTENWRRPKEEVDTLMGLLQKFLQDYTDDLRKRSVKLEAIGRLSEIPTAVESQLRESIAATADGKLLTTILALNYSGRTEIVDAVKRIVEEVMAGRLEIDQISPEIFAEHLYTRRWPDPDLFIRTSGEMRISNFLLWQLSYTEIYVTQKLWPDFGREDLREAVEEFGRRNRRYGGVG